MIVTSPSEIGVQVRVFDRFARLTVSGEEASALIIGALASLELICSQLHATSFTRVRRRSWLSVTELVRDGWRRYG
jgi:hypothetical protein